MHLHQLILDNFKSHEHTVISFAPGTNAISGQNKAGKTTIVQAIGLALFDFCSGKQGDYIQEGASAASIMVELVSAADDRRYEVTRRIGGKSKWEVRDPQTGLSAASGTVDVKDWLCEHLGVPAGTDLPLLFEGAVGVPQGEMTSAYTQSPSMRQAHFNGLLRVEEYRSAFDKMLPALTLVQSNIQDLDVNIGRLEGETKALPDKEAEGSMLVAAIARQERTQARRRHLEAHLEQMDSLRAADAARLTCLAASLTRLTRWEAGGTRDVRNAAQNYAQAQAARKITAANQEGFFEYEEAQKVISGFQAQNTIRESLAAQRRVWETKKTQSETRLAGLRSELKAAVQAEANKAAFAPQVAVQEAYERAVEDAQEVLTEVKSDLKVARAGEDASRGGGCPFLREPCRNVAAAGTTLTQFFSHRIAALEAAEHQAQTEVTARKAMLGALGTSPADPKTLYAIAESAASARSAVEQQLKAEQAALDMSAAELERIATQVAPYAARDGQAEAAGRIIRASAAAHDLYQANQPLAAKLEEYTLAEQKAQAALGRVRNALEARRQQQQEACTQYNADLHQKIRVALVKTRCQQASAEGELKEKQTALTRLRSHLVDLRQKAQELSELRQQRKRLAAVKDHLTFVRAAIKAAGPPVTALLVARISRDAQEIYRALMGDDTLGVRWEADYAITLLENAHERGLDTAAGSERVAAALAVRLALLQSMGEIRFAFFDEPTIHLDEERRSHLVERLLKLKNFSQLFVISHDDAFERGTDHVVHVEKRDGRSVVSTS